MDGAPSCESSRYSGFLEVLPSVAGTGHMSPTVFRHGPYRFFFFSREETRPHIHVSCSDGEAKFWIKPSIAVAYNKG